MFLLLDLLCLGATVPASDHELLYIISTSAQSQNYSAEATENHLTLSQFINNSSDYLTNETRLILFSGNYSLESELIVENVQSFSMYVWSASSSKAVILCDSHNARFEFRNVSAVTMSGLEFVGCLDNRVISVGHFQLENSGFFGNGHAMTNGFVLSIEESVASLDRVAFISAVETSMNMLSSATLEELLLEYCYSTEKALAIDTVTVIGILLISSSVGITQGRFEGNKVGLGNVIYGQFHSDLMISNTVFVNNSAREYCNDDCCIGGGIVYLAESQESTVTLYHTTSMQNSGAEEAIFIRGGNMLIEHSKFANNTDFKDILYVEDADTVTITHSSFTDNYATFYLIKAETATIHFTEFIDNIDIRSIVFIPYHTINTLESITNNVFINNSAAYEIEISPVCRPGLGLSLGSSHCIQCSQNWRRDLIGIVVAAFIAGIALVTFMLALNMTVAVGTLNGILFYAHIVAANASIYFLPFSTPNFVTVFISWLNLDIGFDVCFYMHNATFDFDETPYLYRALIQLVFPTYVILLVIVVIVASEHSSKFASLIGEGNPAAVLATMILLSCVKLLREIFAIFPLLHAPYYAFGSRGLDFSRLVSVVEVNAIHGTKDFKFAVYSIVIGSTIIPLLCVIYIAVVFSWQWLL